MAASGVASAMKFFPGIGTAGGALIMSASLYAVTLVSGWFYLKAFCIMAQRKGKGINASDLKATVDEVLSNKKVIKVLFTAAKKDYKLLNK